MSFLRLSLAVLAAFAKLCIAAPAAVTAQATTVQVDGRNFTAKGLVAFGTLPSDAVDSYGETLGGLGSSIALESFRINRDGSASGSLRLNPDRGHNTQVTTDFRARSHSFGFTFAPVAANSTTTTGKNFNVTYTKSQLYRELNLNYTTGLDPTAVRKGRPGQNDLPIAPSDSHVAIDQEGFAFSADGIFEFVSDEYGPYVYVIDRVLGHIVSTIAPPDAILPIINGTKNFTSSVNPDTGRAPNQGFEGLTLDSKTNTLWALLQSATIQDSDGGSKTSNRNARLVGWNVANPLHARLVHEYVVQLPISKKLKTYASSELHIIDSTTFLVLARDGSGLGDTDSSSTYKSVDIITTKGATDIAGTLYDSPANPVAPKGVLLSNITATPYTTFNSLIDPVQLAKFGLHNNGAFDSNLIAGKLESIALASTQDKSNPDDYYLFVVQDNDFITQNGFQAAQVANGSYVVQPYSDPYPYGSIDTQFFVYQVTLPGANVQKPLLSISIDL